MHFHSWQTSKFPVNGQKKEWQSDDRYCNHYSRSFAHSVALHLLHHLPIFQLTHKSFIVGPTLLWASPRFTLSSKPLPLHQEVNSAAENDSEKVDRQVCVEEISGDKELTVRKIGLGDFMILRMIGKGAFGKVFQVNMKGYGDDDGIYICAIKVMKKDTIIKNNHVYYMRTERDTRQS